MKRRTRFGFFGYLTVDYQAAQAYLDARAAEGWALAEVWLGIVARFRRTDRTDLRYCLDIADPVAEDTPEYRAHCREAGWERLYTVRYMNIYRSLAGAETASLQAEDEAALRRYRGNLLRWFGLCLAALAALTVLAMLRIALVWFLPTGSLLWLSAASGGVSYLQTILPAAWLGGAAYLGTLFLRARQWRAAPGKGEAARRPDPAWARARGLLTLFTYLGVFLLLAFTVLDLVSAPSPKPLILLMCLTAAAFLFHACSTSVRMRQPRRVRLWRCAGLMAFLLAVGLLRGACTPELTALRAGLTERLPQAEGAQGYDSVASGGSFLLGYARGTKRLDGYKPLVVEYYDCRSEWMADRMVESLRGFWMKRAEGEENLWTGLDRDGWHVLSRQGREVRYVTVPPADGAEPYRDEGAFAVAWAAGGEPVWPTDGDVDRLMDE